MGHTAARAAVRAGAVAATVLLVLTFGAGAVRAEEATWMNLNPPAVPDAWIGASMTYDSESDRGVLWGWTLGGGVMGMWAYDDNANRWTRMPTPTGLSPLGGHDPAIAYDSESDRVVLFGGGNLAPHFWDGGHNQTSAYDVNTNGWTFPNPATTPAPRWGASMAYDSRADRMILFGGCVRGPADTCGVVNDTWAYDLDANEWTWLSPYVSPPPLVKPAIAYDSRADRVLLFGGTTIGETWAYDFNANSWTNRGPADRPPAASGNAMAYDSRADRTILVGPWTASETWAYDYGSNTWTNLSRRVSLPAYRPLQMAYDSVHGATLAFGGKTWTYDFASNAWTNRHPPAGPRFTSWPAMVYDAGADRVVLFGGATWAYDLEGNVWTEREPALSPSPRSGTAIVFDSVHGRIVLFGGYESVGTADDTWTYDYGANTWADVTSGTGPPPRLQHAMAYDSRTDRVVVFGGCVGYGYSCRPRADTWTYDPAANAWLNMTPVGSPPARMRSAMVYDPDSDRVLLFGGFNGTTTYNDTWSYDVGANVWTSLAPATAPAVRSDHGFVYDARLHRAILFGGVGSRVYNDTWSYDVAANAWTELHPSASPSFIPGNTMAYDSRADRVILWGGEYALETWAYGTPAPSGRPAGGIAWVGPALLVAVFGLLAVAVAVILARGRARGDAGPRPRGPR